MRKILLGSTALVAATAITAGAAKADISISGWNTFGLGYGNVDTDGSNSNPGALDIYENGEIYFHGSTEMDNGMSLSWDVQLETENDNGNFIDENYFTIGGDFGSIVIGQENLPNYKMHYSGGLWVGNAGISSNSYTQFTGAPGGLSYFHSGFMNDTAPIGNDQDMISYYSPRVGGVQIGLGWLPDSDANDGANYDEGGVDHVYEDVLSIGANYDGDMGGTGVGASIGYVDGQVNLPAGSFFRVGIEDIGDVNGLQTGLRIMTGGLTVGISYAELEHDYDVGYDETAETLMMGVKYETGPHQVGLSYGTSDYEAKGLIGSKVEGDVFMLAHDYAMGGGVSLTTSAVYLDVDPEGEGNDSNGMAGMVMLNASF